MGPVMSDASACEAGRLSGKVVIVTGAAGGIGLATCKAVAAEGAAVVAADLAPDRINTAIADLPEPSRHLAYALDVRDEAANQALVNQAIERYGRIDALVACAGILRLHGTPPKPLVQTSIEEFDTVLDINLKGIFLSNRAVLPVMVKQRSGIILNIASVSGIKGRAHDGPYCASKFGVIGLSQSIQDEVRTYGIKVQAILPGSVDTPFWEQNHPVPKPAHALPAERVADLVVFMLTQPEDTVLMGPVIAPSGARRRKATLETPLSE
jgi:3-oxoacyl-[acyl-carrier protein] reductase